VPQIRDPEAIRAILETDRAWALYPLGDLDPELFGQCCWLVSGDGEPALVLVLRAFSTPVLFAMGKAGAVLPLLDEIGDEPELFLHLRPEVMPSIHVRYDEVRQEMPMTRLVLDPARFAPGACEGTVRLYPDDLAALKHLYADGAAAGEAPEFFVPGMLERGVYYGIREGRELVAAAGTHLVVPAEGIGAIGNVYTRRDRRGRGMAARVTGAVARELVGMGLRTIGLNVSHANAPARRVYERLGFQPYCDYYEGLAVRKRRGKC
jgi:ribosomal protein S18 acetylase RimI-like enzyme